MASLKKIVTFSLEEMDMSKTHHQSLAESMSQIETRHTRTSLDYEVLIREIKSKHREELKQREAQFSTELEELNDELNHSKLKITELNGRLEESRNSREDMLANIKKARRIYERRISDLEKCLAETNQECKGCRDKTNDSSNEKIGELKEELEIVRNKNHEVNGLLETERSESNKKEEKITELGNMIERMDKYLQEMEKKNEELFSNSQKAFQNAKLQGTEKGAIEVLEYQLEICQTSLETCRSDLSDERHKVERLESEMWTLNKEFGNAKVDVRFLTRENKKLEEKIKEVNTAVTESKNKIGELETSKIESENQISSLKNQVQSLQESEKSAILDRDLSHKMLEDTNLELQRLKSEIAATAVDVRNKEGQLVEMKKLQLQIEEMKSDQLEKESLLEDKERKIDTFNKSIGMLREACVVLENQLEKFETVLTQKNLELDKALRANSTLENENVTLRNDIKKARADLNEAKSLKIYSDKKLMDVELCLQSEEKEKSREMKSLLNNLNDLQSRNEDLSHKLRKVTADFQENESTVNQLTKIVESVKAENASLKIEVSKTITELVQLKDLNIQLKSALEEAIRKAEQHKTRYENLSKEKTSLISASAENNLKHEATISQQMKLIEHLKSQNELLSTKKKKFRLFGGEKESPMMTTPLRESNTPNIAATPRRLIIEHKAVKNLEEMSTNLKNELAILKTRQEIITHKNPTLPTSYKREECILLKQKAATLEGPRMSHDIPHRLTDKLAMKTSSKCWKCQDPLYFGRYYSMCNACPAIFHIPCAVTAQNTCGLPKDVVMEIEKRSISSESNFTLEDTFDDNSPEGWMQLASNESWEQHYVRLEKHKMSFYSDQSCKDSTRESFPLCSKTRVELRVDVKFSSSPLIKTLEESRIPFLIKIVTPKTDSKNRIWKDENAIYLLTENSREKRFWSRAIMNYSPNNTLECFDDIKLQSEDENLDFSITKKRILKQDGQERLDINCAQYMEENLYLLGCEEGLFSRRNDPKRKIDYAVKIDGVGAVYQMEFVTSRNLAFMIEGTERRFVSTSLGLLKACSQAAACSKPKLSVQCVSGIKYCHLFATKTNGADDIVFAIATQKHINILAWSNDSFVVRQSIPTRETVTCMLPTRDSLIFGCDKLYELDLKNFELDEFIDESDSSMFYLLFSCREFASFPMAILDVSTTNKSSFDKRNHSDEYLLCFPDMATFVDSYGRRTRCEDIVWTKLPLAVAFRHPNLYVLHFTSMEIIPLAHDSYTRRQIQDSKEAVAEQISIIPESKSIALASPRLLGNSCSPSLLVACIEKSKTEVFEIHMEEFV